MTESDKSAAFFRVEGALLNRGVLSLSAYVAGNAYTWGERALRLGSLALAAPLVGILGQNDRSMANRLAYMPLRGMSEDRIHLLAEEYFEEHLKDNLLERGVELLQQAKSDGHHLVLLSEAITEVASHLATALKADHYISNRLEYRNGTTTGRLLLPIIGGHEGGKWATQYATEQGLHMSGSKAYAAHAPDLLLLASVGYPCAVNPDYTLRRAAAEADWPIIEYGA